MAASSVERGVPAGVAALVGPLELDVERAGERARERGCAVRVGDGEPVAGAAGEADEPLGVLGDDLGARRGREQVALAPFDPRAGVRVGQDPAEVLVAAAGLAEERDVARSSSERDLGAGDRAQPEVLGGVGELERAVDAVVVGERERVVAELGRAGGELLGLRGAVEERVGRVRVQLDVSGAHCTSHAKPAA